MNPDSLKRLIVFVLSSAALYLAPKLGLHLAPEQVVSIAGLAAGYLMQSGIKSAAQHLAQNKTAQDGLAQLMQLKKAIDQARAAGAVPPTPPAAP